MLEIESDSLTDQLPGWHLDDREVAWLWLFLERQEDVQLNECQLNSKTMRDQIARTLRNNILLTRNLNWERDTKLLPNDVFDAIEKNGRQPKWLYSQTAKRTGLFLVRSSIFNMLTEKEKIIALFDIWDEDFGQKERMLSRLLYDWAQHVRDDRIFSWFKDKDERTKCTLAWNWLEKNKPRLTLRTEPFTKLTELLEFFDQGNASAEEKELYVEKIKRRWSTQKTRENATEKKQYNFVLSNSINAILDKLAVEHQLSRTKVLEQLLLNEEHHGLYLHPNHPKAQ